MEQDVEPQGQSSHRGWGHDDRVEMTVSETVHNERPKAQADRRTRLRSKRPDLQIYVPRARRMPHADVETKPGAGPDVTQVMTQENVGQEEQLKPRISKAKGRGRASMERYIPKAKRNVVCNDSSKIPADEVTCDAQFECAESSGDPSRSLIDSHGHTKKTKSKRSRSNSEKDAKLLEGVANKCLGESTNQPETIQSGDGPEESILYTPRHYPAGDAMDDSVSGQSESVDIVNQDPVKPEVIEADSMEVESNDKVESSNNAEDDLAHSEVSQEVLENDSSLNSALINAEVSHTFETESPAEMCDHDAEENYESPSSTEQLIQEVHQDDVQDLDCVAADTKPALIKRENSFVEHFEADKTLQVHYSENCQYDTELEKSSSAQESSRMIDSISQNISSSINVSDSETDGNSCDPSFNPTKRRKSEDGDMHSENKEDPTQLMPEKTDLETRDPGGPIESAEKSMSSPASLSDSSIKAHSDQSLIHVPVDINESSINSSDLNFASAELKSDTNNSSTMDMSSVDAVPSVLPKSHKKNNPVKKPKTKGAADTPSETNVNMETAEDSWDAMFDDDGEALDPRIMEELTEKVGKVKVQKPQFDYLEFQPADPELDDEAYAHLVEIFDFPSDFITRDILAAFRSFQDKGFDLKWVDDTHCIGVFSSKIAAQSALDLSNPLMKVRPISTASRQTKMKAKKSATFLEPYKPRPVTTAAVARNLVTNALGLTARIPREKRDEERRKLREAKEKKKEAQQLKIDVWDGKVGRCAMDEV